MKKLGDLTIRDMVKACEEAESCGKCPIADVFGYGLCNIFDMCIDIHRDEAVLDTEVDV